MSKYLNNDKKKDEYINIDTSDLNYKDEYDLNNNEDPIIKLCKVLNNNFGNEEMYNYQQMINKFKTKLFPIISDINLLGINIKNNIPFQTNNEVNFVECSTNYKEIEEKIIIRIENLINEFIVFLDNLPNNVSVNEIVNEIKCKLNYMTKKSMWTKYFIRENGEDLSKAEIKWKNYVNKTKEYISNVNDNDKKKTKKIWTYGALLNFSYLIDKYNYLKPKFRPHSILSIMIIVYFCYNNIFKYL